MVSTNASQAAWNAYWQAHQTSNSFGCEYTENEGPYGVVNRYWLDCFALLNETDTVCDLGAGNGALAKLFVDSRDQLNCKQWFSTDIASVNMRFVKSQIQFKELNAEEMVLDAQSIDVFVSMFGIEYAKLDKVFNEVFRCLKTSGRYQFLLHHPASVITKQSEQTLLVGNRFIEHAFWRSLPCLNSRSLEDVKHALLQQLNYQMQQASLAQQEEVKIIGHSIFGLVQTTKTVAHLVSGLSELLAQLKQQNIRLVQQVNAAIQTQELNQLLEKSPLSCYKLSTLMYDHAILGWSVIGKK